MEHTNIDRLIKIISNMEEKQKHSVVLEIDYLRKVKSELINLKEELENNQENENSDINNRRKTILHGGTFDK